VIDGLVRRQEGALRVGPAPVLPDDLVAKLARAKDLIQHAPRHVRRAPVAVEEHRPIRAQHPAHLAQALLQKHCIFVLP
jgi:hypothetical protein